MEPAPLPNSPQPTGEPALDFYRLYGVLVKRLWLIGAVFIVVLTSVAFWTFRQVPIYRAEASLVIDSNAPQVLKNVPDVVEIGPGGYWGSREYFETQYRIIKSRAVAEKVVARLGLAQDLDYLHIDPSLDPAVKAQQLKNADPVAQVAGAITVVPVKDSRVVVIQIDDPNPQRAADLANAVAAEYAEQNVDRKIDATRGASEWLTGQLLTIKKRLEDSEKALYQFKEDHDVLSTTLEARQNISSEKLVQINDTLTKTELRRVEIESRRQNLQELLAQAQGTEFRAESFKPVADNALISDFKREYFRLQSEKAELSEKYFPEHPKVAAIEERLTKVKADIGHAIQVVLDASEGEYRQVVDEERRLKSMLEGAKQEALAVNKLELQYDRLKREREQNSQVYDLMVKRQKEVDVSGLLKTNNIRPLDPALVPTWPSRPNRSMNLAIAALLGLVLGIALVILLEFLDNTVKSAEDVEKGLGLPLLGILPSIPSTTGERVTKEGLAKRDLYVDQSPNSSVSECARTIRTNLLFASPDRPFKVLLVASTAPQEGKTTAAITIGITMAQSGNRVLIVDGDLRKPRLHRTFGVPSGTGLSTAILGESAIEDSIKSTSIDQLFVMPAGPVPPNPAELLQSERYADLIKALTERFDRIIVDSPPVGYVTDGLIMTTRADGLVLVLRSGKTPKKLALQGRRALVDVKAHIYGAVLNDVDLSSRAGQYYYYYRYGYYPSEKQEAST